MIEMQPEKRFNPQLHVENIMPDIALGVYVRSMRDKQNKPSEKMFDIVTKIYVFEEEGAISVLENDTLLECEDCGNFRNIQEQCQICALN